MDEIELTIEVDEESYEIKAIKAYLSGDLKARDLRASLEVSRPTMYRMVARYVESGPDGLRSRKFGNQNRAHSKKHRERILAIVREHYHDFGPQLASEKLEEVHGISVVPETLRRWMKEAGLWVDRESRKPRIHSSRKPRDRRGELVQVDGSYHRWFEKRGDECCLLVFIDDATSELKLLRLVEHENSYNYMTCLKSYIESFGRPLALFSDRHSIFRATNPTVNGERRPTQFARACGRLDIRVICAKTPQAKGRVERANRTLQDRLVKELRLKNISTMEAGNRFLEEYRLKHNEKYARVPKDAEDAHLPSPKENLNDLLTYVVERKVFLDLSISFNKTRIILDDNPLSRRARGKRVTVALDLNGGLEVLFEEHPLPHRVFDKIRRVNDDSIQVVDHKRLGAALNLAKAISEAEPHHFKRNNHVLAGFRNHFRDPADPGSRELQHPPPELRRRHNGRPRAPLGNHPIVILEGRLENPQEQEKLVTAGIAGVSPDEIHGQSQVLVPPPNFALPIIRVQFGEVTVDLLAETIRQRGEAVHLTRIEFRILSTLIRGNGRVLSHRELLMEVWGPGYEDRFHYLHVYMRRLRQKLEDNPAVPCHLMTVSSVGYQLTGLAMSEPGVPVGRRLARRSRSVREVLPPL
jgi:DNA-binding winged helix-turn-helix (wHTH) protein/transposase